MERLYDDGRLTVVDLGRVYAGAFLSFHTFIERSLERLFLGLLMSRLELKDVRPLIEVRSEKVGQAVLAAGRRYVDWLPLDQHAIPRAKAFLSSGRPFSTVSSADKRLLESLGTIRNALTHESAHARRRFRREFVDDLALPPNQRTPSGYLRGQHHLGVTRFDHYLAETSAVFARLCADDS
jgi:hypothetical protein